MVYNFKYTKQRLCRKHESNAGYFYNILQTPVNERTIMSTCVLKITQRVEQLSLREVHIFNIMWFY